MPETDVAKLRRLIASIESVVGDDGKTTGAALPGIYRALRTEALSAIPEGLRDECGRICPDFTPTSRTGPQALLENRQSGDHAKLLLLTLAGWLQGLTAQP